MWFVDTTTLELAGPFFGKLPPFAILSHTWGNDELSLQDFKDYQQRQQHYHKNGFRKIQECCRLSESDGYKYAWIDTVCIDKTSSAELTEAINSMYDWYAKAAICYTYLEDLQSEKEAASFLSDLKRCRWFTRGWTLQELIAPKKVIFFNKNWNMVGDKNRLSHNIGDITGICCPALLGNSIRLFSIADRMSWASRRETTRPEDLAYCLLGIFGVNMPLLYGEGNQRAFLRLQQEILRHSNDQSIFAWSIPQGHNLGQSSFNSLASSPSFFRFSSRIVPSRAPGDSNNRFVTNQGITLKVLANPSRSCIILKCHRVGRHALSYFTVRRLRSGSDEYVRTSSRIAEFEPSELPEGVEEVTITLRTDILDQLDFYRENRTNYLAIARLPPSSSGYYIKKCCLGDSYDDPMSIKISPFASEASGVIFSFHHKKKSGTPFFVALFCSGDLEQPNSVGMENDFIGVYNDTGEQTVEQFYILFTEWFGKREADKLPNAAKLETTDGLDIWRLQDGQLVHVSVSRHLSPALGYAGCVRILAGRSWEVDVKPFADWGPFERGE